MNWLKEWFVGILVRKILKLALEKADVKPYAIQGAQIVDKYADKYLGGSSEEAQNLVAQWLQDLVNSFNNELKRDQK